jgi:multisubunit Na+/H+ antiporter MnhB subunit
MTFGVRLFIFLCGFVLFIMIFELVRRKKFREDLSIGWLLVGVSLIFSSFADLIIDPLAFKLGIHYPPALAFIIVVILLVLVMLYFSVAVSDLKSRNKELSQKIALLEYKLSRLYKKEKDD